jgi:hypothetical protein
VVITEHFHKISTGKWHEKTAHQRGFFMGQVSPMLVGGKLLAD